MIYLEWLGDGLMAVMDEMGEGMVKFPEAV